MSTVEDLPVVVIGAGPVGLAAAARLVERGICVHWYWSAAQAPARPWKVGAMSGSSRPGPTTSTPPRGAF